MQPKEEPAVAPVVVYDKKEPVEEAYPLLETADTVTEPTLNWLISVCAPENPPKVMVGVVRIGTLN